MVPILWGLSFGGAIQTLYIIRGLPNSGKTTFAKSLPNVEVHSADDYFERKAKIENKTYAAVFDPRELGTAHDTCQHSVLLALVAGYNVAVTNTFTQHWEMDPYFALVHQLKQNGVNVNVVVLTVERSPFATEYNEHNVPDDAMRRMDARWERVTFDNWVRR